MDKITNIIKIINEFYHENNHNKRSEFIADLKRNITNGGNHIYIINNEKIDEVHSSNKLLKNIKIVHSGDNSLVILNGIPVVNSLNINIGEKSLVYLGKNFTVRHNCFINISNENCILTIGDNANWGSGTIQVADENELKVIIGNNFLAATNSYIRASDGHVIYDLNQPEITINESKYGIFIGDKVWLGHNVTILKDVEIPNNCIIAACSVVLRKHFMPNCIIAGNPAIIIRGNVGWDNKSIAEWKTRLN